MFVDACVARYQQLLYDIRHARQTDKRGPCLPRGRISTTSVIPRPDIIQCKYIFSVPLINSPLRWCVLIFPGIAVYPGGAKFLACGHYYNNVVTSKGMYPWLIIHTSAYSLSQKIMSCHNAIWSSPVAPKVVDMTTIGTTRKEKFGIITIFGIQVNFIGVRILLWFGMGLFNPYPSCMMTSSNGNIFRVTGPLCGEFTGHRWIPRTKASDAELWCFLWSAPKWTFE